MVIFAKKTDDEQKITCFVYPDSIVFLFFA